MADIRSSGIFADTSTAAGLFRGNYLAATKVKTPGAPLDVVSRRDVSVMYHDFIDNNDVDQYIVTNDTSGTATVTAGSANGLLRLTATTDNQGLVSVQHGDTTGAVAHLTAAANRIITFEALVTLGADLSVFDWFVGIGEVDTTFVDTAGALLANGADNHVGFHHLVADAGIPTLSSAGAAVANVDSTQLGSGIDRTGKTVSISVSDATAHRFGFRILGTTAIEFYLDNRLVHVRVGGTAFDTAMTPTFTLIADGTARTMDIDYVLTTCTR